MPGTNQEIVALVNALLSGEGPDSIHDDHRWGDGTPVSRAEWGDLLALCHRALRQRKHRASGPQRKAMRLLRPLLSASQRHDLARLKYFYVTTPAGSTYRLDPRRGHAERVERHGRRWFAKRAFCLHDAADDGKLPAADVTIAHLLLLLADEPAFLREANATPRDDQLWNRAYLRRRRAARNAHAPEGALS